MWGIGTSPEKRSLALRRRPGGRDPEDEDEMHPQAMITINYARSNYRALGRLQQIFERWNQYRSASHKQPGQSIARQSAMTTNMSATARASTTPKPRSIDFLTPEQLQRKREGDRKSQRESRERTKNHIESIDQRVRNLEQRNEKLEQQMVDLLARFQHENVKASDTPAAASLDDTWNFPTPVAKDISMTPVSMGEPTVTAASPASVISRPAGGDWGVQSASLDLAQMINSQMSMDTSLWSKVLDDSMVATTDDLSSLVVPQENAACAKFSLSVSPRVLRPTVWSALPTHTGPTCPLDLVVLDLLQSRRKCEPSGGNLQEFSRSFPSVQSLLNPACSSVGANPVTNSIINNIIYVMTAPTLPEQIAILYVMSRVIRWQISPTESNYDSLPAWLRPTPSQIVTPHPAWLDMMIWPRIREHAIRHEKYHNMHATMSKICNESMSINWPYQPSDMVVQVNGTDIVLNPIFERHIGNLKNWTVGRRLIEVFPEFEGDVNIGLG